jgi:hypothetical protein
VLFAPFIDSIIDSALKPAGKAAGDDREEFERIVGL